MPDIRTRIGRYCSICQYIHDEEYLMCDYCNEHKTWIYLNTTTMDFANGVIIHAVNVTQVYLAH